MCNVQKKKIDIFWNITLQKQVDFRIISVKTKVSSIKPQNVMRYNVDGSFSFL